MAQLGEILKQHNLITQAQLEQALTIQKRNGSRLGDILVADGTINYYGLYQAVAKHHELPFIDLLKEPPQEHLLVNGMSPETMLEKRILPWRRTKDGTITVAVTEYDDEITSWCKKQFGEQTQFVITSPFDIRRTIENTFGDTIEKASRLTLWKKFPQSSARITMPANQRKLIYTLLAATIIFGAFYPLYTGIAFIAFCHLIFIAMMIFKCIIFINGMPASPQQNWQERNAELDERTLPVYTVLIPMYREKESLPSMLKAMQNMDYPASKLDIKLVLEADDKETLEAAYALKPSFNFEIIRVPFNNPRTKPRACNYALRYARGELITIFDADDRPEPMQLKKAVMTFRASPPDVVCVQGRLNYYNANDNLLTRLFSLEYTILFHFMLYGLQRLGIPIPLGGTSNHISVKRLREIGEWDPYNVTEDADLGTRLCAQGARTCMLDSYTMEEAPNRIAPWIRQRSRWIKGYMQTWLVHMRNPRALYRSLGFSGFIGFQFFVGLSCFTFLVAPIVWAVSALWFTSLVTIYETTFPIWLIWFTAANLAINLGIHWFFALHCSLLYRKHKPAMMLSSLFFPFYLILHSVAGYKGLWQLIVKPHFWEKTMHGLSKQVEETLLEQDDIKKPVI